MDILNNEGGSAGNEKVDGYGCSGCSDTSGKGGSGSYSIDIASCLSHTSKTAMTRSNLNNAAPALLEALEKAQQDINWMLNSKQFLNGDAFNYIDSAIKLARGE